MSDTCIQHIENYWKSITTSANRLFANEKYAEALSGYQQALYRAEVLTLHQLDCERTGIPFVQVYIISCNNIASTYEELNQRDEAEKMLTQVISYIIRLIGKAKEDSMEMLQSELRRASLTYMNFVKKNYASDSKKRDFFYILVQKLKANEFQIYN